MPSDKPRQTLADYMAIAISPALIMALVGSLVFFLLEVLYSGKYEGRLQWILFFFVFAIVLIARISMEGGIAERAPIYGLVLAVLVFIGLERFVEYPQGTPLASVSWAINLALMALVWWCAHRLTWDCTLLDDSVDASGAGVLEAAGLEDGGPRLEDVRHPSQHESEGRASASTREPLASILHPRARGLLGWWDRYRQHRAEQQRRPHTPGVWVVYFSLAALPLFGLGQSLIPPEDVARRRYVFWLMGIYVASGLGLLLSTAFLGLRRYLRQRKLQMPAAMAGLWLTMGGGLIVLLLLAGALLPRPNAEYPLIRLGKADSPDREASRYSVTGGSPGKQEGRASADQQSDDKNGQPGSGNKRDQQGGGKTKGKAGGGSSSQGQAGSGQNKGNQGDSKSNHSSNSSNAGQKEEKTNDQNRNGSGQDSARDRDEQKSDGKGSSGDDQAEARKKTSSSSGGSTPPRGVLPHSVSSFLERLAPVLKWMVFGVLAVVVIFFLLRSGLKFLANFTDWARRLLAALQAWWAAFFAGPGGQIEAAAPDDTLAAATPRPFSSFQNPFLTGGHERQAPEELVRYSFEALQALAWERGVARQPDETPLEFARRIDQEIPELESQGRRLAGLYARAAYGQSPLPASCVETLRQFWQRLEVVSDHLSAVS